MGINDRLPNADDTVRISTMERARPWFAGKVGRIHPGATPIHGAGGRWIYPVVLDLDGLRHSRTEIVWFPAEYLEIIESGPASRASSYR